MTEKALRQTTPSWLRVLQRPVPPAPPPAGGNPLEAALDDYETLRGNYSNVVGQLIEAHDLLRELAHQNEALEKTISEDRTYYQGEINRLQGENAELLIYKTQIRTRFSTIVEVILAADRVAQEIAIAPTKQTSEEQEHETYAPARRAVPRFVETEAEDAEVRRVMAGITTAIGGNGALPMNAYGERESS